MLQIQDLYVSVEGRLVLNGVDLTIKYGETHALMGPNGSGKSTLSNAIMGHPKYKIEKGDILLDGKSILSLKPHERALLGLFLAFQYPKEISGITMEEFLLSAYRLKQKYLYPEKPPIPVFRFKKMLSEMMNDFNMDEKFAGRYLNHGFSGGEKKKSEMLQMAFLQPQIAIMDETDSGLDVDALKIVCDGMMNIRKNAEKPMGTLIITHYNRILKHISPDFVHVLKDGKIVKSGGKEFAEDLCKSGYQNI